MAAQRYAYDVEDPLVYGNEMGSYKTGRQLSFITPLLCGGPLRVLDAGGGSGRIAVPLARLGHELTVVDPSGAALELLGSRNGGAIKTACSDLMTYVSDTPYDVVLLIDMVKYMTDTPLDAIFSKANSLLGKDGLLVLAEINAGSWRNRVSEWSGRRRGFRYNIASAAGYRSTLRGAGFRVVRQRGYLWMPLPFNSDSRLVRLLARTERTLPLERWSSQSPWLLVAARKEAAPAPSGASGQSRPVSAPHQRTTAGESPPPS